MEFLIIIALPGILLTGIVLASIQLVRWLLIRRASKKYYQSDQYYEEAMGGVTW